MELKDAIDYLETAPRSGRPDFGKTVLIPEAQAAELVKLLQKLQRAGAKSRKVIRGAVPE